MSQGENMVGISFNLTWIAILSVSTQNFASGVEAANDDYPAATARENWNFFERA